VTYNPAISTTLLPKFAAAGMSIFTANSGWKAPGIGSIEALALFTWPTN